MIRMAKTMIMVVAIMFPNIVIASNVVDLLIMQDVGQYKFIGKGGGLGPGIVGATAHFNSDHADESYGALYFNDSLGVGVKVEVSQHSGVDSDKWLMHEVEDAYRDEGKLNATVDTNVQMRLIDGKNVYFIGIYDNPAEKRIQ